MKLLAVILATFMSFAHAEYIDLTQSDIVRQAICTQGKRKMLCVAVKKDDKLYVVVIDEKGEHSIYHVSPTGNILLWSRESV